METQSILSSGQSQLTDIIGLRLSGIFPLFYPLKIVRNVARSVENYHGLG